MWKLPAITFRSLPRRIVPWPFTSTTSPCALLPVLLVGSQQMKLKFFANPWCSSAKPFQKIHSPSSPCLPVFRALPHLPESYKRFCVPSGCKVGQQQLFQHVLLSHAPLSSLHTFLLARLRSDTYFLRLQTYINILFLSGQYYFQTFYVYKRIFL